MKSTTPVDQMSTAGVYACTANMGISSRTRISSWQDSDSSKGLHASAHNRDALLLMANWPSDADTLAMVVGWAGHMHLELHRAQVGRIGAVPRGLHDPSALPVRLGNTMLHLLLAFGPPVWMVDALTFGGTIPFLLSAMARISGDTYCGEPHIVCKGSCSKHFDRPKSASLMSRPLRSASRMFSSFMSRCTIPVAHVV